MAFGVDGFWTVIERTRQQGTRESRAPVRFWNSMQVQLHTAAERQRSQLLAATRVSLRGEVTALQRVREREHDATALIGESRAGIECRRGGGQSVDPDNGQQVGMTQDPERLAAERDALGPGSCPPVA